MQYSENVQADIVTQFTPVFTESHHRQTSATEFKSAQANDLQTESTRDEQVQGHKSFRRRLS